MEDRLNNMQKQLELNTKVSILTLEAIIHANSCNSWFYNSYLKPHFEEIKRQNKDLLEGGE